MVARPNVFLVDDEPPAAAAAIYARFSTDLQNERSVEDQLDLCRAFAARSGFQVVASFADKAKSGASMLGRDGLLNLMQHATERRFNVVIVEDMSRLSRDMEDLAGLHKRLTFVGIKIVEVHGGEASTMSVALRGLIGQMYREDNAHKVRRGLSALVKQGLSAGGRAYGYRPDPANRGRLTIVPDEEPVILRIFRDYDRGLSPKAICRQLNAEYVKPPRGRLWAPSALYGSKDRGSGILRNPLYAGRIVWNKVQMLKDPATGKRISRSNPDGEWQVTAAPDLRIVPEELFERVRSQLVARSHAGRSENVVAQRRPKRLLSGLLKCGACGAGMSVTGPDKSGRDRLRCSAHTNSAACPNPKTFYLEAVEQLVIGSLTKELANPEQIYRYAKTYMEQRAAEAALEGRRRVEIEARLSTIEKDNQRLLEMLLNGVGEQHAIDARMKAQGRERDALKIEQARLPDVRNYAVHPAAIKSVAQKLQGVSATPLHSNRAKLEMTLHMLDDMGELSRIIRELVKTVTLYRDEEGAMIMRVDNRLGPFLSYSGTASSAIAPKGGDKDGSGRGT